MTNNIDDQVKVIKNLTETLDILENGMIDTQSNDAEYNELLEENNKIRKKYLIAIEEDLKLEKGKLNKMLEGSEL